MAFWVDSSGRTESRSFIGDNRPRVIDQFIGERVVEDVADGWVDGVAILVDTVSRHGFEQIFETPVRVEELGFDSAIELARDTFDANVHGGAFHSWVGAITLV